VFATAIVINAGMLGLAIAWSGTDPAPLWSLLAEDRIVEWMQFLCFSVIAVLLGFVAVQRWQREPRVTLEFLGLVGMSAVVALAAVEEISWFQRVIGVESPEFFLENNRQAETNLHNLALGSASIHKTVILKVIFLTGMAHNLVLPLLARWKPGVRNWAESLGLYLPPLSVSLVYLLLVTLSHLLIDHPRKGELGEMFGSVHYLATVFMAYFIGAEYGRPPVIETPADRRRVSALFAAFMVFLVMVAWLLAAGRAVVPD
jgi:hypothetical protein